MIFDVAMLSGMWPFKKRAIPAPADMIMSVEVRDGNGKSLAHDEGPREPISDERYEQIMGHTAALRAKQAEAARLRMVRGRDMGLVSAEIDQLKRDGKLEEALELTYECMDAAERSNAVLGWEGAGKWYERAAIILRKLEDYDAEVRMIEDLQRRFPEKHYLEDRMPRATALLEKQRQTERG
jgi:hypothetical protein